MIRVFILNVLICFFHCEVWILTLNFRVGKGVSRVLDRLMGGRMFERAAAVGRSGIETKAGLSVAETRVRLRAQCLGSASAVKEAIVHVPFIHPTWCGTNLYC